MLTSIVSSAIFVAFELTGVNSLGLKQLAATILNALFCGGIILFMRHHPERFKMAAMLGMLSAYLVFTTAVIWVVADEFRMIWYYILMVCAYLLLGALAGLLMTLVSVATIMVIKFGGLSPISDNALVTFSLSLLVASAITYALVALNRNYLDQLTAKNRQLEQQANLDPLTGVWNSRAYYQFTERLFSLAKRSGTPCATLFIDLDHFKDINDRHGHETGDRALQMVAACLARNVRKSDLLARIGGEEFVVFLPDTDSAGARELADKLRTAIGQLPAYAGAQAAPLTISIGVAQCTPADADLFAMQHRADQAMYLAKRHGRNRVVVDATSPL